MVQNEWITVIYGYVLKKQHAVMKIRNEVIRATYEFFNKDGFTKVDPPILTASAPEGTSELFHTKDSDQDAFLSQSGQLYLSCSNGTRKSIFIWSNFQS